MQRSPGPAHDASNPALELDDSVEGLHRTRSLFVATSAIPAVFPPVVIDGHVHSDGGVVSNVLVPLEFDDFRALAERLRALGVTQPVKVRLWVVMNVWTHAKLNVTNPASRGGISDRSNALMFVTHQPQLLERLADLARAVVPGKPAEDERLRMHDEDCWILVVIERAKHELLEHVL